MFGDRGIEPSSFNSVVSVEAMMGEAIYRNIFCKKK